VWCTKQDLRKGRDFPRQLYSSLPFREGKGEIPDQEGISITKDQQGRKDIGQVARVCLVSGSTVRGGGRLN